MASAEVSRRVEKVVGRPPPSEMGANQRSEFHAMEQSPPQLRAVEGD
jgi:hypothetical protein